MITKVLSERVYGVEYGLVMKKALSWVVKMTRNKEKEWGEMASMNNIL